MRLQLMIDQIVFGLEAFRTRRATMPQRLVDGQVYVSHVLPQVARVRVNFAAVRTLGPNYWGNSTTINGSWSACSLVVRAGAGASCW